MRLPSWPRWVWRCYAATAAAVGMFVVCSQLRMWHVYEDRKNCVCVMPYSCSLWEMLAYKPDFGTGDSQVLSVQYGWESPAITTAVATHLAAIAGAVLGGVRWRKGEETSPPNPRSEPERGPGGEVRERNHLLP